MCGIAGMFEFGGPADEKLLRKMSKAIAYRGPDDFGSYVEGSCGLAFRRLAIVDEKGGNQPLIIPQGTVLVCNGEIYNAPELRRHLERRGHIFRTLSDCEVILHLYREKGERCVEDLEGMFAFALWDPQAQTLLLARDPLGVKPLYYHFSKRGILFASEVKAILEDPRVERKVSAEAIEAYLQSLTVPDPLCAFENIHKLSAGTTLLIKGKKKRERRYWSAERPRPHWRGVSREQISPFVLSALDRSVSVSLRADRKCGVFLSGGIDSSVVSALAAQHDSRVLTYSVTFQEKDSDESFFSRMASKHIRSRHTEVLVKEKDAIAAFEEISPLLDEPFADASLLPTYLLSRRARRDVKVALSGEGSDELFAGSAWHGRPDWKPGSGHPYPRGLQIFSKVEAQQILRSMGLRKGNRNPEIFRGDSSLSQQLNWDLRSYLPSDLLYKVDRASMWNGLEVRVPFLNRPFVELVQSLPDDFKWSVKESKIALKRAVRALIPAPILNRKKKGFSIPMDYWLWKKGKFRDMVEGTLRSPRTFQRGLFNESELSRLWEEHDRLTVRNGYRLWSLFVLETWFRQTFDSKAHLR